MAIAARLQGLDGHSLLYLARALDEARNTVCAKAKDTNAPVKIGDGGSPTPAPATPRAPETILDVALAIDPARLEAIGDASAAFIAVCREFWAGRDGTAVESLSNAEARAQYAARTKMRDAVRAVAESIEAAGQVAARFPRGPIEAIEARLTADIEALTKNFGEIVTSISMPTVAQIFPRALTMDDVDTLKKAAAVLAKLFADPSLEAKLIATGTKVREGQQEWFVKNLGAYALLADAASTALDYAKLPTGWDTLGEFGRGIYPTTREGYRNRAYDPKLVAISRERQIDARLSLRDTLKSVLASDTPTTSLQRALARGFADQIGIPATVFAGWKPKAAALREAIAGETLIPLRALYDATGHLDHRFPPLEGHDPKALNVACRQLVVEVARHIAEGDYAEWRASNPLSSRQLARLTPDQRRAYLTPLSIETVVGGRRVKTREEFGNDLLWFTKVGGPSHGFDMISQCLLPLLANVRSGTVIIDDPEWPKEPAGRAYLRLINTAKGEPMLYLEMAQPDFPYKKLDRMELKRVTIEHALAKAEAMNVPLAVFLHEHEPTRELLKKHGVPFQAMRVRFKLDPSAGVFEASDSLLEHHHTPQTKEVTTEPIRCAIIRPGKAAEPKPEQAA
jgi:hypothetical protein